MGLSAADLGFSADGWGSRFGAKGLRLNNQVKFALRVYVESRGISFGILSWDMLRVSVSVAQGFLDEA